jgi:uridine kinase
VPALTGTAGGVRYRAPPMSSAPPFFIGVAGGTCSGKTTIAERLAELMGEDNLALVKLDSYYWARDAEPFEQRVRVNYDHPDSFDWPLLNSHLDTLRRGGAVPIPVYDYVNHTRSPEVTTVRSASIVVVEGILVLYEESVRQRCDLKIFVDTDSDLRFIRRLQRDVAERGRTADSIVAQYLQSVRPSHLQFIEPSKRYADVIFPEGGMNTAAIDILLARVRELVSPR